MSLYALTETIGGAVREIRDFAEQPPVLNAAKGVQWEPYTPPAPQPPTPEQIIASLTNAVQEWLDGEAQRKGYDNIVSACSYAGAPNPFQAESQSYLTWRGNVWAKCYAVMAEVKAGRPIPTPAELLAELPACPVI